MKTASFRILATACLLAVFALTPARAQVTIGEVELLSSDGISPSIDADGRNGFVAVWTEPEGSDGEIFGSLLPPGGSPQPPFQVPFQVNTRDAGPQSSPNVAAGPRGDFMVVWQGLDAEGSGVFGQTFSRSGVRNGLERRLSQGPAGPQSIPRVAAGEDGSFVAVWANRRTARFEVVARRFSASGSPVGPEIPMQVGGEFNNPAGIAAYPGGFAVAWNEGFDCSGGRPGASIAAIARFDSSGQRVGRVYRVGSRRCDDPGFAVAALVGSQAGALAVLRTSSGHSVQRFAPSGEPVGARFALSARPLCSGDRCDFINAAAMDDRGRLAVIWDVSTSGLHNLFLQVFTPRGRPLTDRVLVNPFPSLSSQAHAVALANDGTLAVVRRQGPAGFLDEGGLYLQRFELP
jgi:hypothetical protein